MLRIVKSFIRKVCEIFVYKYTKTMEYVKKLAYFLRKIQSLRVNFSRIFITKNAKFSRHYFKGTLIQIWKSANIFAPYENNM